MFVLLVQVQVRLEMLEAFEAAIYENASRSVERDPGCLRFDVSQECDDPTRWTFYEVYTEEAAHAAHCRSAHFAAYTAVADRALVSKTVTRHTGKLLVP